MKVVCSYCRKDMGEKEPYDDDRVSHSMCQDCWDYFQDQIDGLSLDEFLEKFDLPILIINEDGRMVAANKMALEITGKSEKEVVGFLGGEVMECVYARLPEGCGQTNHCLACTVRNTVMAAMESGEPQVHVPVELQRDGGKLRMIISTEKIGSFVRMIIESEQ